MRCRDYQLHKYTRCNGHLGSVQTVSHQGGVCARHPDVGEQLSPEKIGSEELRGPVIEMFAYELTGF